MVVLAEFWILEIGSIQLVLRSHSCSGEQENPRVLDSLV